MKHLKYFGIGLLLFLALSILLTIIVLLKMLANTEEGLITILIIISILGIYGVGRAFYNTILK